MRLIRHLTPSGPAIAIRHADGSHTAVAGDPVNGYSDSGQPATLGKILAPVAPTNIIGIGLNYRKHALEGKRGVPERPMWFMKTSNAVQHPGEPIRLPVSSDKVDYEGELAVVLGRDTHNVTREAALEHVLGYTIAIDVSARDWQFEFGGGQFNHGKSFDTFCPLGPELVTPEEFDPATAQLTTRVNGETRQNSPIADLVFDVPTLVSFLSTDRTLPAGTVILTGTPSGVGYAMEPPHWLAPGDEVSVEISGLGCLTNPVAAATP